MKSFFNKIKVFFKNNFNGLNGAISLFLVLIISPMLSVALVLVESARYQSAVELMDEVIDSSAFSTLADYDSYLQERFGLLSTSQETSLSGTFDGLLQANVAALGNSATISSSWITGMYALSNRSILKQQIEEYGEISVLAEVILEGSDLEEMLDELTKAWDLDGINDTIDEINSGAKIADKLASIIEDFMDLSEKYDEYSESLEEYEDACEELEDSYDSLSDYLDLIEAEEENLEDGEEADYHGNEIISYLNSLKKKSQACINAAEDFKSALSEFADEITGVVEDIEKLNKEVYTLTSKASSSTVSEVLQWASTIAETLASWVDKIGGDAIYNNSQDDADALDEQIEALGEMNDAIGVTTSSISRLASYSISDIREDIEEYESYFLSIKLTAVVDEYEEYTESCQESLNEYADEDEDTQETLTAYVGIFQELVSISFLYDGNLDANVSAESLLNKNVGSSTYDKLIIESISTLVKSCNSFIDGITGGQLLKAVKALGTLLLAIVEFLGAVVTWAANFVINLALLVADVSGYYDNILLYGYAAYNLPNRTNYDDDSSGKTLSGYKYSQIFELAGGRYSINGLVGKWEELSELEIDEGTDTMFKGAEAEYMLVGSTSEIMNQISTVFNIYMFRLVLNIIYVLTDSEVQEMASAAGVAAWVVYIVIILAEPLLETLILVNGGSEYLICDIVYLTPSYLAVLFKDLADVAIDSSSLKKKINKAFKESNGELKEKKTASMFDMSYEEHLMLLTMLSVDESTYLKRMQNIIQMEADTYYSDYDFSLRKSYTYVYVGVSYNLNSMLGFDKLADLEAFTIETTQYMGY